MSSPISLSHWAFAYAKPHIQCTMPARVRLNALVSRFIFVSHAATILHKRILWISGQSYAGLRLFLACSRIGAPTHLRAHENARSVVVSLVVAIVLCGSAAAVIHSPRPTDMRMRTLQDARIRVGNFRRITLCARTNTNTILLLSTVSDYQSINLL